MQSDEQLVKFFLNSESTVVQFETLEITHPSFSRKFYFCRNNTDGISAKLEDGSNVYFEYVPLKIEPSGVNDDLDQTIKVSLGDLGEYLPAEMDRMRSDGKLHVRPILKYRTYRSDDLNKPMYGPFVCEIADTSQNREGASFEAKAPSLNTNGTGEIYKIERFTSLRGFL